ncbi:hypothetical protein ACWGKR_24370 [Bacillus thuringiensis]|uniref:hypothetical protein n=1 Tax=Bacillus thuringiensis TaxID=1428 RepID=UPI0021D65C68|nr:hypothetical protein [Bacillus thuringiensis]MCU7679313.1 hypothetical protein [Bacillus thuringiensis]
MTKKFVITKPSDLAGFSSFKCSLCGEEFKLRPDEVQEDDVLELFCPSCGIPSSVSTYYTEDIKENALIIAENEVANMINDLFKGLEKTSKKSKNIKFKAKKQNTSKPIKELYEKDDLNEILFLCCNRNAKLSILTTAGHPPFCPYCGVN